MAGKPAPGFTISQGPPPPNLWQQADQQGELVFSFNQNSKYWEKTHRAVAEALGAEEGFCLGLCAYWIALRVRGTNFDYDTTQKTLGPAQTFVAMELQRLYQSNRFTLENFVTWVSDGFDMKGIERAYIEKALRPLKLKIGEMRANKAEGPDFRFILDCATAVRGPAIICWAGKPGHATALDARPSEGVFDYFDPNYGHFRFDNHAKFHAWFTDYLITSKYRGEFPGKMQYVGIGLRL